MSILYMFFLALQNVLQVSVVVFNAIGPDSGTRTARSETFLDYSKTKVVLVTGAAPHPLS